MDTKDIKELIQALSESKFNFIDIKHEGTQIVLSMETVGNAVVPAPVHVAAPVQTPVVVTKAEEVKTVTVVSEEKSSSKVTVSDADLYVIKSPIVGTFYTASGPDAAPFAKEGDKVKKGQTLCIIEAMKLMNEIESDVDGEVVEVLVSNEAGVEYGQPLFKIKKA